ncbi:looped-hinge helix DNA binding domain, AbrB family [Geoglobus ahangari]|uniref:Looped-hinge helix DNA binding domain, AbrB family n=1 Tax=Geoglobus ahangari TaxID=113653 RepID=A0A0F7IEH5_9EURY|nr:AbrB/MazE/SpoVT family DNA-binding domain-containing protein [Geoglobus ahangari]AKG90787.1 looped-hinge helix DNA binding domain, AbrB family [Geoglobus ahangari]
MEKLESIVKVSGKGQVVIPKDVRDALGIKSGEKLAVIVRNDEIVLRKVERLNFLEMSSRISSVAEKENIDVDRLVTEAVEWARKQR